MNIAAATANEPLRYLRGSITAFSLYLRDAADADRHVENPAEQPAVVRLYFADRCGCCAG